jgi:hypothetical protein
LCHKNAPDALSKHVDDEDKGTIAIRDSAYETRAIFINESGLHSRTYLVWTERGRRFVHRLCKTEEVMIPFELDENYGQKEVTWKFTCSRINVLTFWWAMSIDIIYIL